MLLNNELYDFEQSLERIQIERLNRHIGVLFKVHSEHSCQNYHSFVSLYWLVGSVLDFTFRNVIIAKY